MMDDLKHVDSFCAQITNPAENVPLDGNVSVAIKNYSHAIVGIALRALVVTKYKMEINNGADRRLWAHNEFRSLVASAPSEPRSILELLNTGRVLFRSASVGLKTNGVEPPSSKRLTNFCFYLQSPNDGHAALSRHEIKKSGQS